MENKDIILIILIIIVLYLLFCDVNNKKNYKKLEEQLSERFSNEKCVDGNCGITESIKNLGILATKLQEGGITIPGDVTIEGNLHVKDANGDYKGGRIKADTFGSFPDAWIHRIVVPDDKDEIKIIRSNTENMKDRGYKLHLDDKGSIEVNGWLQVHKIVVPDDKEDIQIIRSDDMKGKGYKLHLADKGSAKINGWLELSRINVPYTTNTLDIMRPSGNVPYTNSYFNVYIRTPNLGGYGCGLRLDKRGDIKWISGDNPLTLDENEQENMETSGTVLNRDLIKTSHLIVDRMNNEYI